MYTKKTPDGTADYMAPELLIVSERNQLFHMPTPKSDMWSLGATLVELFTENKLYGMRNLALVAVINLKQNHVTPEAFINASASVKNLLGHCLCKEAHRRPSASEFVETLKRNKKDLLTGSGETEL